MNSKTLKITIIGFLFLILVLIRIFEDELFYDPFILFYKKILYSKNIPEINLINIILNTFYRYLINFLISIIILFIAFNNKEVLRFSIIFYTISFIILIGLYLYILSHLTKELYQVFFYIRRFLIQPIFILILLPAFYYQQETTTKL